MHLKFLSFLGICALLLSLLTGCTAYMAGNSNLGKENYEAAISNYIEALSKNPKHWQARQRLGFAYLKTGQFDKAVREFETSLVEKPGEPFATFYLGLTWLNKGENLRAIEAWRTYKNEENPLVEEEINRQLMVLEMVESLRFAKQALAEEEKLQRTPPQSGTVSVFYFKDITPDNRFRPVQKALATMIITDLAQIESLQVMERLRVQCLLTEMQMGQCGIVDEQSAPRAGRLLGAENLIVGTLEPGSMAVKTSVTSTSKKDVVGGFSVTAAEEEFFKLQKEVVFNIIQILKVSMTAEEEKLVGKYHTKSFKAVVYFGQGLDALDTSEWEKAKNLFKMAYQEDPEFLLAKFYQDGCPGGATPAMATMTSMSQSELADMAEASVGAVGAPGGEEGSLEEGTVPGPETPSPAASSPSTGSITVSW